MKRKLLFLTLAFAALTATAQVENLATGAGASATASAGNGSANEARDNNPGTRWEAPQADVNTNENVTWTLDLGEAKDFNTIQILWEGAYSKSFKIEVSTDDENYTPIVEKSDEMLSNLLVTYQFDQQHAQYIRFTNIQRATGYGVSFYEFRVYSINGALSLASIETSVDNPFIFTDGTATITAKGKNQLEQDVDAAFTYSVDAAEGSVSKAGVFTPAKAGVATITVASGDVSNTVRVIALDKANAPAAATNVSKYIYPADNTNWLGDYNGGATRRNEVVFDDGTKAMGFTDYACTFFGNGGWDGLNIKPADESYGELKLSVYSFVDCKMRVVLEDKQSEPASESKNKEQEVSLTAGWNNLSVALGDIKTISNMSLRSENENTHYDGMLLANIYFTKGAEATLTSIELAAAGNYCGEGESVTLTATGKDQYGMPMEVANPTYTVTPAEKGSVTDGKFVPAEGATGNVSIKAVSGSLESNEVMITILEGAPLKAVEASDVAQMVYPASDTQWLSIWNGGATQETPFAINEVEVMPFADFDCTFFGNGGVNPVNYKPGENGVKSLKMSVYSFENCEMWIAVNDKNCGTYNMAKGWNYLTADIHDIESITTMSLRSKAEGTKLGKVIITNIYYAKAEAEKDAITLAFESKGEKAAHIGTGLGQYGKDLVEIKNNHDKGVYSTGDALREAANIVRQSACALNMPEKGSFYNVGGNAAFYTESGALVDFTTGKYVGDKAMTIGEGEAIGKYALAGVTGDVELTENEAIPFTIGETGYGTIYSPKALLIPTGMEAYTATMNEEKDALVLTQIIGTIPANKAVVVKNAGTYSLEYSASADNADIMPALKGSVEPVTANAGFYTLQKSKDYATDKVVGFFPKSAGTEIKAFRAYLELPEGSASTLRFIIGGGDTTGIGAIGNAGNGQNDIYDMQGRKVQKAQKGLYIVGGKKVLVR